MEYEIFYLIGESKEANLDKIRKNVEGVIKKNQGNLNKDEFVKKRRLAYEIKKEARGTYVAKRFSLPDKDDLEENFSGVNFIGEITKELNFNPDILRFVIVKTDDVPELSVLKKKEADMKKEIDTNNGKRDFNNRGLANRKFVKKDETKKSKSETNVEEKKVEDKKEENKSEKKESVATKKETVKNKKENLKKEKEIVEKKKKKVVQKDTNKVSEKSIDDKLDEILNI